MMRINLPAKKLPQLSDCVSCNRTGIIHDKPWKPAKHYHTYPYEKMLFAKFFFFSVTRALLFQQDAKKFKDYVKEPEKPDKHHNGKKNLKGIAK